MSRVRRASLDPVELQIYHHLLAAIPEEMGVALMRAAFSPNIKERLDFSCALTDQDGGMAAQASHIPVHLGSAHMTAREVLKALKLEPGDVILLNDPYRGGTHLPDITVFAPVYFRGVSGPAMGVLARAHHADVGGATPGSMGPAIDVHGEGLVIPPVPILRRGVRADAIWDLVLANTRTPEERFGDLTAQLSAVELGCRRLAELAAEHGGRRILQATAALRAHAGAATRTMLRSLRDGVYSAETTMDGPGTPKLKLRITKRGAKIRFDFAGTDAQVAAPFNANEAITLSCVFYVLRLLLDRDLPTNAGCLEPVEVAIPKGTLLNAVRPAAVAGGNVETSQRIVDLVLEALEGAAPGRIPAASQGTMNNLTLGGMLASGHPYTFYETIAGGAGGGPSSVGTSGIHTHMTNTLNTPIEALENAFPVRVTAYAFRDGSGGLGQHPGGDGVVREFEVLTPARATVMASRRREPPRGRAGGGPGKTGKDRVVRNGKSHELPADGSVVLQPGDRIRIETPGGGGFGRAKIKLRRQQVSPRSKTKTRKLR